MKGPNKKRNVVQKAKRFEKVVAKKATDAQIEMILKEDAERSAREQDRQRMIEAAGKRIAQLKSQRRVFLLAAAFFLVTTIIAGVL